MRFGAYVLNCSQVVSAAASSLYKDRFHGPSALRVPVQDLLTHVDVVVFTVIVSDSPPLSLE